MGTGAKKITVAFLAVSFFIAALCGAARAAGPWDRLEGFALIPDSPARLDDRYIAALFVSQDKQQLAVVVFNASCDRAGCNMRRRAAYSIFNSDGLNVDRYVDPNEHEILRLVSGRVSA